MLFARYSYFLSSGNICAGKLWQGVLQVTDTPSLLRGVPDDQVQTGSQLLLDPLELADDVVDVLLRTGGVARVILHDKVLHAVVDAVREKTQTPDLAGVKGRLIA